MFDDILDSILEIEKIKENEDLMEDLMEDEWSVNSNIWTNNSNDFIWSNLS